MDDTKSESVIIPRELYDEVLKQLSHTQALDEQGRCVRDAVIYRLNTLAVDYIPLGNPEQNQKFPEFLVEFKQNVRLARECIHKHNLGIVYVEDDNGKIWEGIVLGPVPGRRDYVRLDFSRYLPEGCTDKRSVHATRITLPNPESN